MDNFDNKVNELLEKNCYIIDFLPEQVPKQSKGQFFDVEYYMLNSDKYIGIRDKFENVILKLMCYYRVAVCWKGWIEQPKPNLIGNAINEIMVNHSGWLNCLLPDENALLVFEWDCLNLSVFNPPQEMQKILEKIAWSEGLFWRKSPWNPDLVEDINEVDKKNIERKGHERKANDGRTAVEAYP